MLQFYIKRLQGNGLKVGSLFLSLNSVLKVAFIFTISSKTEAGSAGEQPASNKIDAYTVIKRQSENGLFFYYKSVLWLQGAVTSGIKAYEIIERIKTLKAFDVCYL